MTAQECCDRIMRMVYGTDWTEQKRNSHMADHVIAAIEATIRAEREACAIVVEGFRTGCPPGTISYWGEALAAAIRNRETKENQS